MPEPTMEDTRNAAQAGAFGHISGLLGAAASYFGARFQLAGLETKEALVHYAIILGLAIASVVVVIFGYFFFCLGLVFTIAWLIGGENTWIWVTYGVAVLHFGAAAAALLIAKARLAQPMFKETINEFRKDQEWLTSEKLN